MPRAPRDGGNRPGAWPNLDERCDMSKPMCSDPECDAPATVRGLCNRHYQQRRRRGQLTRLPRDPSWHSLSSVDNQAHTAVCAVCGPVSIRPRTGQRGAECMVKRSATKRSAKRSADPVGWRLWRYGISREDFDGLMDAAGDRCMICDTTLGGEFHLDHCHETGRVRGVLCRRCNLGLGWFDDAPGKVMAAYFYLKAHGRE